MRRFVTNLGFLKPGLLAPGLFAIALLAFAVLFPPVTASGAGDASAIRRATHSSDSRHFTNYRPQETRVSSRQRVSGVQTARPMPSAGCRGRR
jgi:hypothetical protein